MQHVHRVDHGPDAARPSGSSVARGAQRRPVHRAPLTSNQALALLAARSAPARSTPPTAAALRVLAAHPPGRVVDRRTTAVAGLSAAMTLLPAPAGQRPREVVPVHDGPAAHRAAAHLGVHAYTFRHAVVLGAGLDEAGGPGRAATLAHELAHAQQMRSTGPRASDTDVETAAAQGRTDVAADPETPYGLFWLIPVAAAAYVLLRPNVANAPSRADVAAGRTRKSVSELQVAGEAFALFGVPGGIASGLARAGYGVLTATALSGAASSVAFRGVQDAGAGDFSGVQAYVVDAATGAVVGLVVGGALRLVGGPAALGPRAPNPGLVHFTSVEGQQSILRTSRTGQAVGDLRGGTGIWALPEDALLQAPWQRAARATMSTSTAQAGVGIPEAASGHFTRAVPLGPVSAYQYLMGVYRAPAGAISMASGQFTPAGGVLADLRGLVFPYGVDAAIWISAAAVSGPPSATAEERGIRGLLRAWPPEVRTAVEAQPRVRESVRSDGPFVVLPQVLSPAEALAGARGGYDPVARVCYAASTPQQSSAQGRTQPTVIYVVRLPGSRPSSGR